MSELSTSENDPFELLYRLLKTQQELIKKGNLRNAERLSPQAQQLCSDILKSDLHKQPEYQQQYKQLLEYYEETECILTAQKEILQQQLKKVAEGKKTVQVYQS